MGLKAQRPRELRTPYTGKPKRLEVHDLAPCDLVDSLTQTYPQLALAPDLLRVVVHLLMTPEQPVPGERPSGVPLPWGFLTAIRGRSIASKGAIHGPTVADLQSALAVSSPPEHAGTVQRVDHETRSRNATLLQISLAPPIAEMARRARDVPEDNRITLDDWCQVTVDGVRPALARGDVQKRLDAMRAAVLESHSGASELSRRLQAYLNGHDLRIYAPLRNEIEKESTGLFMRENYARRDRSRDATTRALYGILMQPVPVYRTSPRTARITPVGWSLGNLSSKVRQLLSEALGWVELDLAHAQLACNAVAWNVQPVLDRLRNPDYHVWDDLLAHIGLDSARVSADDYAEIKGFVKRTVYGLSFGMYLNRIRSLGFGHEEKMEREAAEELLQEVCGRSVADVGAHLVAHPILTALLEARKRQSRKVSRDKGREDALGVFHRLQKRTATEKAVRSRHVLARVAQAQELDLLRPVIDDAIRESTKKQPRYRIVLWQHDGFSVHVKDKAQKETIVQRLQNLVAARAKELDIPTYLDKTTERAL